MQAHTTTAAQLTQTARLRIPQRFKQMIELTIVIEVVINRHFRKEFAASVAVVVRMFGAARTAAVAPFLVAAAARLADELRRHHGDVFLLLGRARLLGDLAADAIRCRDGLDLSSC